MSHELITILAALSTATLILSALILTVFGWLRADIKQVEERINAHIDDHQVGIAHLESVEIA